MNKVYNTDALSGLQGLPDECVDMCVTSPPYWGLRDYGVDGQLGLEPSFDEYISKLVEIFDEVHRVLKDTGTLWVNISDSYSSGSMMGMNERIQKEKMNNNSKFINFNKPKIKSGLPSKSLIGVPERFVIAMTDAGWIRRNTLIWYKPNCMPSSVKDRFTVDFEYLYFFSKSPKYYFEQQLEPVKEESLKRYEYGLHNIYAKDEDYGGKQNNSMCNTDRMGDIFKTPNRRNMRTVWRVNTKPYKGAHFAVFPEDLIETPIKAGCPQFICNKCGLPIKKEIKTQTIGKHNHDNAKKFILAPTPNDKREFKSGRAGDTIILDTYWSDCGCGAGFHPGVVLDPFMGSGTTASVAKRLGRSYIGFELNPEYMDLISERLRKTVRIKSLKEY